MADEQARKDAALQTYRGKLLHHKARAARAAAAGGRRAAPPVNPNTLK
jgi:hypothetical protein